MLVMFDYDMSDSGNVLGIIAFAKTTFGQMLRRVNQ